MAGADTLDGGAGNDSYVVDNVGDVIIEQGTSASEIDTVYSYIDYFLGANLENLTLIGANLSGTGNSLNNVIKGSAGNNILDGGAGADFMAGDTGNDTYIVDNLGDVVSETSTLASEIDTVRSSVNWTLGANLENLALTGSADLIGIGNSLNNTMIGNAGNNTLDGGAGVDFLAGGTGNDTYFVDNVGDIVSETNTLISEIDSVRSSVTFTLGDNVENLTLTGNASLNGYGNSLSNVLTGNAGDNILDGMAGADTLDGGAGNDAYVVDNIGDVVVEQGTSATEIDTVYSYIDYTLGNNVENLSLIGANLNGTGNSLNNTLKGSVGNNTLDGGAGADFMAGDTGNDTYVVDNLGDYTLGANVENLSLIGANLNGTGNSLNNTLKGSVGNNTLNGGAGADFMAGDTGNDTYIVDNLGDVVSETSTLVGEIDSVRSSVSWTLGANLENLTLTGSADLTGSGNSLNNVLTGNDGNNVLDGGLGTDTMIGGKGNDAYALDQSSELGLVQENANEGTDTLYLTFNATAQDNVVNLSTSNLVNVENVMLLGTGAFTALGNSLNNSITGNGQNNILDGGAGVDTLTGGAGGDTFVFGAVNQMGTGASRDVITDFSSLQGDKIDLTKFDANLLQGGFNGFTFIGANDFTGAGQVRFIDHVLSGNVSGNAGADFEIQLVGVNTFNANDLVA
ncbi:beta strand repeat-containing protein [Pseudomonas sp. C9]|uniref:beta strand repeat-containing protein n=1 Tax=Pseudomonas sp. C9 TaxID=1311337 RepID=UPI0035323775